MNHNFISISRYGSKDIVPQYFAKKLFKHLKCIQKLNRIKKIFIKKYESV